MSQNVTRIERWLRINVCWRASDEGRNPTILPSRERDVEGHRVVVNAVATAQNHALAEAQGQAGARPEIHVIRSDLRAKVWIELGNAVYRLPEMLVAQPDAEG